VAANEKTITLTSAMTSKLFFMGFSLWMMMFVFVTYTHLLPVTGFPSGGISQWERRQPDKSLIERRRLS
jgi:hypothetical protein